MKKKAFLAMLVMAGMAGFSACESGNGTEDDDDDDTGETVQAYQDIIDNYTDVIVLPTYVELKNEAGVLLDKVEAFVNETDPSKMQAALEAVCDQWRVTRRPWELSEAFLFGPVASYSLDPKLDSWPLSATRIAQYVESNIELDVDNLRGEGLSQDARGFHTLEYLAFEGGEPRDASTLDDRWRNYMEAVATVLRDDCFKLWYYWNGTNGLTPEDRALLTELEDLEVVDVVPEGGFAERFTTPPTSTTSSTRRRWTPSTRSWTAVPTSAARWASRR